jgi:glycosyltransferase involved in cell wall biosynthesis
MARLATRQFARVSIRAFATGEAPSASVDGVEIRHLRRPAHGLARFRYLAEALTTASLGVRFDERLEAGAFVQLESPLLFEGARRAGLRRFLLNAHNVYGDMARFPQASLADRAFARVTRARQTAMELACWEAAEHVVFCSEDDRARAGELMPAIATRSSVIPNCIDVAAFEPRAAAAYAAPGPVVFIGTTRYPPNFFAVEEICRTIAPACPGIEFWIVGDPVFAPRRVPGNVRILGLVPSTAVPLAAARIAIAPLRHGSGSRLKILEYLAAGVPVVATRKAAEGLELRDGCDVRLADSPAETIEALRSLDGDARARATLGTMGRRLVEQRYDWALWGDALGAIYRRLGAGNSGALVPASPTSGDGPIVRDR